MIMADIISVAAELGTVEGWEERDAAHRFGRSLQAISSKTLSLCARWLLRGRSATPPLPGLREITTLRPRAGDNPADIGLGHSIVRVLVLPRGGRPT